MALIFPFDTTLKGHVEQVETKFADMLPLFSFPKGSFFVSELYGFIKGTNKIVRPGIDYKVLSLNETLKFSDVDQLMEDALRENYVRNAILWISEDENISSVIWNVPYCGGEQDTKPAQYANKINELYNTARALGTTNLLMTPIQAWGGFPNIKQEQRVSGRNIYQNFFDYQEEMDAHGGLGWGKIQLGMTALADTVTSGGDPMELQAFYDWVRHNATEYNLVKDEVFSDLYDRIAYLDDKRVDNDQFIYTDTTYQQNPAHFYLEFFGVILRALNPDETGMVANPIKTNRYNIGHYGLASWGDDISLKAARLFQRKATSTALRRLEIKVTNLSVVSATLKNQISISLSIANKDLALSNSYSFYLVSKERGLIGSLDITTDVKTGPGTKTFTMNYPDVATEYASDVLYGFVLDNAMLGDFNVGMKRYRYVSRKRAVGYTMEVINRGLIWSNERLVSSHPNGSVYDDEAITTSNIEVKIKRQYNVSVESQWLEVFVGNSAALISKQINWATGESEKIISLGGVTSAFSEAGLAVIKLRDFARSGLDYATVSVGYRKASYANEAFIEIPELMDGQITNNHKFTLVAHFGKNTDFFRISPRVKVTSDTTFTGKVIISEPTYIDQATVKYTLSVVDVVIPADGIMPIAISLEDSSSGSLVTNKINVYITSSGLATISSANISNDVSTYYVDTDGLHIETNQTITPQLHPNGTVYDLTVNMPSVVIEQYPTVLNGKVYSKILIPATVNYPNVTLTMKYKNVAGSEVLLRSWMLFPMMMNSPDDVWLVGLSGRKLANPVVGEPFKIMYRNSGSTDVTDITAVIETATLGYPVTITWGGDAVNLGNGNYQVTKPKFNIGNNINYQVSVDGWVTINSITAPNNVEGYPDLVGFNVKTTVTYGAGLTRTKFTRFNAIRKQFSLFLMDQEGAEVGINVDMNQGYVLAISSLVTDLSVITSAILKDDSGALMNYQSRTYDAESNTVFLHFIPFNNTNASTLTVASGTGISIDLIYAGGTYSTKIPDKINFVDKTN